VLVAGAGALGSFDVMTVAVAVGVVAIGGVLVASVAYLVSLVAFTFRKEVS
jgi:hypothetical protein